MANTILSADEAEKLLKPIEDHVAKIQAQIDEARADGENKVSIFQDDIERIKHDGSLTKSEKKAELDKIQPDLAKARKVEADNRDKVRSLVSEAESYLNKHYDSEYLDKVKASCAAELQEAKKKYDARVAQLNSTHKADLAKLTNKEEIKEEKYVQKNRLFDAKMSYDQEVADIKAKQHEAFVNKYHMIDLLRNSRFTFAQNQAQLLDEEKTVFDTIDYVAKGDIRTRIRDILGAFMFGGEASDKKVKVLSGGERSRLAMIKLLLEPVNFLILDEPTNHLDMRSKDVLKEAISAFDGTVILVSHDRDFLDGIVSKVYEFGGGKVREHLCGIYEFLQKKQLDNLNQLQTTTPYGLSTYQREPDEKVEIVSEGKINYQLQKEQNRKQRKLERQVAECEAKIEHLEQQIKEVEEKLSTVEGATDPTLYVRYQELKDQVAETEAAWEQYSMELEEL